MNLFWENSARLLVNKQQKKLQYQIPDSVNFENWKTNPKFSSILVLLLKKTQKDEFLSPT